MPLKVASKSVFRRRLIVCMDGTWQWFEHVNMSPHTYKGEQWIQIPGYFQDVGLTEKGKGEPWHDVDQQICDAYHFVCNTIRDHEKDEIWILGDSKGEANAARSLVEMILHVGVLNAHLVTPENLRRAHEFYRHYSKIAPENQESHEFRMRYRCSIPPIRFFGCFDIDESHGMPQLPCPFNSSLPIHVTVFYRQHRCFQSALMKYAAKQSCAQELLQIWLPSSPLNVLSRLYQREPQKLFNLMLLFFDQADEGVIGVGSRDQSIHESSTLRWMMEIGGEKGMVFSKPIKEICRGGQHLLVRSFRFKSIYRMLIRKSRRIEIDASGKQVVYALCDSEKTTYLSDEELDLYPLDALPSHIDCLGVPSKGRVQG